MTMFDPVRGATCEAGGHVATRPMLIASVGAVKGSGPGERTGDGAMAAEALFREHGRFIARYLTRLGIPTDDVDDLVQEVFLVAHRAGGYKPGPARPTTWLAEIALRLAKSRRRAILRSAPDADAHLQRAVAREVGPEAAASIAESMALVQRALDTLDVDHRAVFILFELEGESGDAIAAGLGIPLGTVHSRLHYARREFLKAFDRLGDGKR